MSLTSMSEKSSEIPAGPGITASAETAYWSGVEHTKSNASCRTCRCTLRAALSILDSHRTFIRRHLLDKLDNIVLSEFTKVLVKDHMVSDVTVVLCFEVVYFTLLRIKAIFRSSHELLNMSVT